MGHLFDIENRLREFFPVLFELLDNNSIDWNTVNKAFTKKFEYYQQHQAKKETPLRIQASFYNIITDAIKNDKGAVRLIDYIQKLFEELTNLLDREEKTLIKGNIFGMLTNMDLKYLNFLGELSVLHRLKKTLPIKLIATESPLEKGQRDGVKIDFLISNIETNKCHLVEVVNIHLNDKNTLDADAIKNLLHQKIGEKLSKKGLKRVGDIHLIPVLWGQWNDIKQVVDYYSFDKPQFENTTTPVCFMTFTDQKGVMVHKFGTIDTIFENTTVA